MIYNRQQTPRRGSGQADHRKIFLRIGSRLLFCFFAFIVLCSSAQAMRSPDVVAVRVYQNTEHKSALNWYRDKNFKGAPQSIVVDGYDAIRDGRTVYINAGNVSEIAPYVLFTNIYLISYNGDAELATVDIFGRMLERWKFNTNSAPDFKLAGKCVISKISCNVATDCAANYTCDALKKCVPNASIQKSCIQDSECPQNLLCNSNKAKVIRDVRRLADLQSLNAYLTAKSVYPGLEAGTYKQYWSVSTWPSWQQTLGKGLGISLPVDPINTFGACYDDTASDPRTCWNETTKTFSGFNGSAFVTGSSLYYYQYNTSTPANSKFRATQMELMSSGIVSSIYNYTL